MNIENLIFKTLAKNKGNIKKGLTTLDTELNVLLEGIPFWIIFLDAEHRCLYGNSEARKHAQQKTIFNKKIEDVFPSLASKIHSFGKERISIQDFIRISSSSGERYILVRSKRISPQEPEKGLLLICADLTALIEVPFSYQEDRNAAIDVGRRICSLLSLLFHENNVVLSFYQEGTVRSLSTEGVSEDTAQDLSIFLVSQILSKGEKEIGIHSDSSSRYKNYLYGAKHSKAYTIFTLVRKNPNIYVGTTFLSVSDTAVSKEKQENIAGEINKILHMSAENISVIQETNLLMQKQYTKIQNQQDMLRAAIDSIPALISIFNDCQQIAIANQRLKDFSGQSWDFLNTTTREDLYKILSYEKASNQPSETPFHDVFTIPGERCYLTDKNMITYRFVVHEVEFSSTQGNFILFVATSNIIEQTNEVLARVVSTLKNCNYIISHDLRGPFNNIGYLAGMALQQMEELQQIGQDEESSPSEKVRRITKRLNMGINLLKRIEENAHDGEKLVDSVLSFTRVDKPQKKEWVNVQHCLNTAIGYIGELQEDSNTILVEPLPQVLANKQLLQQVFQNLLSNAFKYRHPSRELSLSVRADETPQGWTFHVSDNGIGIPEEHQDKIWGMFQSLDTTSYTRENIVQSQEKSDRSRGIGLAIVKRIVERHGGYIYVNSSPGKGTCFSFFLPNEGSMFDA